VIPTTYDILFQEHGANRGIDWLLLKAQAYAESAMDPTAKSPVGAMGIAQFMPATWKEWSMNVFGVVRDPFDPDAAIPCQAAYMRWLRERYVWIVAPHDLIPCMLAAYNWGLGNVNRRLSPKVNGMRTLPRHLLPDETQKYISRIEKFYQELKDEHEKQDRSSDC